MVTRAKTSTDASALNEYVIHPAAAMFPLIDAENLAALARDIREHGQQEPIWMYQGKLLDGRNRVLACAQAGIKPTSREWKPGPGETPTSFVMSRNLHRRHLTASQRAALAVELETVLAEENRLAKEGAQPSPLDISFSGAKAPPVALSSTPDTTVQFQTGDPTAGPRTGQRVNTGRVRDQAAAALSVSSGYVNDAKDLRKAAPDMFESVKAGELSLTAAQDAVVAEARAAGTVAEVKLRPGAVKAAMERLDRDNAPKRKTKPDPIKLPKATKVQSSATSMTLTVTFGNPKIAEGWLNRMQDDPRVLDLDYTVLDKRPKRPRKSAAS